MKRPFSLFKLNTSGIVSQWQKAFVIVFFFSFVVYLTILPHVIFLSCFVLVETVSYINGFKPDM